MDGQGRKSRVRESQISGGVGANLKPRMFECYGWVGRGGEGGGSQCESMVHNSDRGEESIVRGDYYRVIGQVMTTADFTSFNKGLGEL